MKLKYNVYADDTTYAFRRNSFIRIMNWIIRLHKTDSSVSRTERAISSNFTIARFTERTEFRRADGDTRELPQYVYFVLRRLIPEMVRVRIIPHAFDPVCVQSRLCKHDDFIRII